jgi:pSer/pThr/pTyr-binding forkhead associated (FHA) protein
MAVPSGTETRRITGILVTYTWRQEGEIFPIREDKNFIGSGDVSSEASPRSCDVQIPHDKRMSSEHALILSRQGNCEILDQMSSNGTFLDGQLLNANQGTDLRNYAEIMTGSTLWTFIKTKQP